MKLNVKKEGSLITVEVSVDQRTSLRTQKKECVRTQDVIDLLIKRKDLPRGIPRAQSGLQELPLTAYYVVLRADSVDNENPKALTGTWILEVVRPPPVAKKSTKKSSKTSSPKTSATTVKKTNTKAKEGA